MRTVRVSCFAALLILTIGQLPSASGADGSESPRGEVHLPTGPKVVYDYHFDRNAFAASIDTPAGLVALTRSGNLLRFDPTTLTPNRAWVGPSRATCLGQWSGGSVLVGFEDGRVTRLDPATFAQAPVASLPGPIHWVGARREGGVAAVVVRGKWVDPQEEEIERAQLFKAMGIEEDPGDGGERDLPPLLWTSFSEVHDLGSGRVVGVHELASSFFMDRADRVWLGSKERGYEGWVRCVDLVAGKVRPLRSNRGHRAPTMLFQPLDGTTNWGCFETEDGQVWAYGGQMHATSTAEVVRVNGARVEHLFECEDGDLMGDRAERRVQPDRPNQAIERIDAGLEPGSLLVFAANSNKDHEDTRLTIFRTDATLKSWNQWLALDLRSSSRRDLPDLLPAVRAVHRRPAAGELILATERDGYVRIANGRQTRHLAPGQLEADSITTIVGTTRGAFLQGPDLDSPWRYRDGRWSRTALEPGDDLESERYRLLAGPGGTLDVVCDHFTARRWEARAALNPEHPAGAATQAFTTPDGSLWHIVPGGVERFDGTRWVFQGQFAGAGGAEEHRVDFLSATEWRTTSLYSGYETREKKRPDGKPCEVPDPKAWDLGNDFHAVTAAGPPWVIHDRTMGRLMILAHGANFSGAGVVPLAVTDDGLPLSVDDALAWSRDEVLITTRKGLNLCAIATGTLRPAPLPDPGFLVRRLARDGLGRVWLGGDGLGLVDAGGRWHDLAAVPMVGRSSVATLGADPTRREGMIVSFGVRGVAILGVEPAP